MILEALSNGFGPSGCESEVRKIIIDAIADHVDECRVDPLGNVLARQAGGDGAAPLTVMAAAHMDEVGLMISHADGDGFLHFLTVGGIDDRVLPAKTVRIGPKRVRGVILSKPVHLCRGDERNKVLSTSDLVIDIGVGAKEEAEQKCPKGDYAVFETSFEDRGGTFFGKAFDDRLGCAVLVELVRRGPYPFDFAPVFTTMEEVGLRGAVTAAYAVDPDVAFVLEGTIADDMPQEKEASPCTRLGGGPAITVADGGVLSDRRLVRYLSELAREHAIPFQIKQPGVGGTDAGAVHRSRVGVPSVPVAVPARYIHSPVSVSSSSDLEWTIELMTLALKNFRPDVLAGERQ